jgi:hypothetical protein
VFNPQEEKLLQECKLKISSEYFPIQTGAKRKKKMRRSVAQKYIKHFSTLGVDPFIIADVMLYNIELRRLSQQKTPSNRNFYKSMLNSFEQAIVYMMVSSMNLRLGLMLFIRNNRAKLENEQNFNAIIEI